MSNPALLFCGGAAFDQVSDALSVGGFPAGEHGVGDQLRHLRENRLQASDDLLEQPDAAAQRPVDRGLDRAFVVEVHDTDSRMALADPVDAADPLLDPHRVPGHVVVDQRAAELEIQPLGGGVGAQEQIGVAVSESALDLLAVNPPPLVPAAPGGDLAAPPGETQQPQAAPRAQDAPQEVHCVGVLREHHDLAVPVTQQLVEGFSQARELAVWWQRPDPFK